MSLRSVIKAEDYYCSYSYCSYCNLGSLLEVLHFTFLLIVAISNYFN